MYIAPGVESLKTQLELIEERFSLDGVVLHNQRNVVKQFTLNKATPNTTADSIDDTIIIVVKSFKIPGSVQGWIYANWRHSKARRSFEYAKKLQKLGVNTHRPLAYTEKFSQGKLKESYFFSELIEHDFTIRDILNQGDHVDLDIIRQFVAFTYAMHKKNVLHLDHSPGNTLIKKTGHTYRFFIVDINRVQFKKVGLQDGLKNFSRLSNNLNIIKYIANCYAKHTQSDPEECYQILRQYQTQENRRCARKKQLKNLAKKLFGH
jgi:serine/threonine protein kinase